MRIPTLITALALGATAMAQSPLTTTFTSNNGQAGNMLDLVATNAAGVTIDFFDVNLDAGSWDLEVYKLTVPGPYLPSVSTPADWTLVGSTTGSVIAAASAASIALPPLSSMRNPAWAASGCEVATMFEAITGMRWEV